MRKRGGTKWAAGLALAMCLTAAPVAARDDGAAVPQPSKEAKMADVAAMMGLLFQAKPLDAAQEARVPAARAVVTRVMPEGFYARMMERVISGTMAPMFALFSRPSAVIEDKTGLRQDRLARIEPERQARIAELLEPGYATRGEAIAKALGEVLGTVSREFEPPMRDGLSRAYAVRFDDAQLADIAVFFATPTGGTYASESMTLFADPQVMAAMMQSLPLMMKNLGGMEAQMKAAMATVPPSRAYADIPQRDRAEIAAMLGMSLSALDKSAADAAKRSAANSDDGED